MSASGHRASSSCPPTRGGSTCTLDGSPDSQACATECAGGWLSPTFPGQRDPVIFSPTPHTHFLPRPATHGTSATGASVLPPGRVDLGKAGRCRGLTLPPDCCTHHPASSEGWHCYPLTQPREPRPTDEDGCSQTPRFAAPPQTQHPWGSQVSR